MAVAIVIDISVVVIVPITEPGEQSPQYSASGDLPAGAVSGEYVKAVSRGRWGTGGSCLVKGRIPLPFPGSSPVRN